MKKRILALMLALSMALTLMTGCGGGGSGAKLDENGIPESAKADIVNYLTDGALSANTPIMTVGGEEVPASYYLYWVGYYLNQMNAYVSAQGQYLDVTANFNENQTAAEHFQELAENSVVSYVAMEQKANAMNLTLTAQDEADLDEYRHLEAENTVGLIYNCTTMEDQVRLYTQYTLGDHMKDILYGEGGDLAPTNAALDSYISDSGLYNCRYILCKPETEDDAAYEEMRVKCQGYYDELKTLTGDALLQRFQEIQAEANADGNTNEFSFSDSNSLVDGFRETVAATDVGSIAMTDKTGYGYFVILRLDVDRENLAQEYISSDFAKQMISWGDSATAEHTEAYDKLDVAAFCQKKLALDKSISEAQGN